MIDYLSFMHIKKLINPNLDFNLEILFVDLHKTNRIENRFL